MKHAGACVKQNCIACLVSRVYIYKLDWTGSLLIYLRNFFSFPNFQYVANDGLKIIKRQRHKFLLMLVIMFKITFGSRGVYLYLGLQMYTEKYIFAFRLV